MEIQFLDVVEDLHRWCAAGQSHTQPDLLTQTKTWLLPQLQPPPTRDAEWLTLWQTPLAQWWPMALPAGWEAHWSLLSRREATLTAEALTYLETYRPGIVAALLTTPQPLPLPAVPPPSHPSTSGTSLRWTLDDLVMCVNREVQRRDQVYPHLVQQHRLTSEQAEQELSQMRAVLTYLLDQLREGTRPQQQVLF
jgi:hypothetical protein